MLTRYYQRILDTCEPYLIARPPVLEDLDRTPFHVPIEDGHIFDPMRTEGAEFLNMVKHLDALAYSPLGLEMPSWVFYDCAVMPGAVFGFARRASQIPAWAHRGLAVPKGYDGLVPVSLFIVIPTADPDLTLAYSLCSVNQLAAGVAPEGLWRFTLAVGTRALGIDQLMAVCQWRSSQLGLYAGLGPLELITAYTPAHDNPHTATFRVRCDASARQRLLRGDITGPEGIDSYLDPDDVGALRALQVELEAGVHVAIVGPAEIRGAETRIPLQHRTSDAPFADPRGTGFRRRFQG